MKEDCFESWKRGFFERGNLAHVVTRLTANLVCLGLLLSVLEVLWKGVLNCKILGSSYQSTFLANTKTKLQPLIFLIIDDLLILYLMHARILLLLSLKITYNLKTCFGICVKASEETLLTPRWTWDLRLIFVPATAEVDPRLGSRFFVSHVYPQIFVWGGTSFFHVKTNDIYFNSSNHHVSSGHD